MSDISLRKKPVISWWRSGDPCYSIEILKRKITDITIIDTKHLSDDFVNFCLENRNRIFLHVIITGMNRTELEPNIPSVKSVFFQIKKLIDNGFSQKQILVVVNPVLPNENGLKALKLLLRIFTEYRGLRLRFIRFSILNYKLIDKDKFTLSNQNIAKRASTKKIIGFLKNSNSFIKDYYDLLQQYQTIISIDKGDESLIGIRAFGFQNDWVDENGNHTKLITYENNNRFKPVLNVISFQPSKRCINKCLLCPHRD